MLGPLVTQLSVTEQNEGCSLVIIGKSSKFLVSPLKNIYYKFLCVLQGQLSIFFFFSCLINGDYYIITDALTSLTYSQSKLCVTSRSARDKEICIKKIVEKAGLFSITGQRLIGSMGGFSLNKRAKQGENTSN